MTLQQMRYLAAVAEYGSISEAAKKLYVAQSSISGAIKEVEEQYGLRVFHRNSKGVALTREGEELLIDLKRVLRQMDFVDEKYSHRVGRRKRLCISTQHHICGGDAFLKLLQEQDGGSFYMGLLECKTGEVLRNVEKGISDLGIIFYTLESKNVMIQDLRKKGLIFNHIAYQRPHIFLWEGHPLAKRESLRAGELEGYPFVTYDRNVSDTSIFTDALVPVHKIDRLISVTDRAAAYSLMRSANAFVVGSGYHSADERYGDIVSIPLLDAPEVEVGWVVKSQYELPELAERYIALLTERV